MQSEVFGALVNQKAKMSITLDNSDFQFLQDQLVELKNKNYELAEKNRRSQADFEAAKAKICSLQLKLEEQERDFQVTSTTLRREIEAVSGSGGDPGAKEAKDEDYKSKYKKVLLKAKELQQRYEKSVEIVQQLDSQNKNLNERVQKLELENASLSQELATKQDHIESIETEYEEKVGKAVKDFETSKATENEKLQSDLIAAITERDDLRHEVDRLTAEVSNFSSKFETQAEERKIQERKGLQIVKELKRQLAQEKNRSETLQQRLEKLLSQPATPSNSDIETPMSRLSTSSSTNGNSNSNSSNGNGSRTNQDISSVGSWSFVPPKCKLSNIALNETMSLCSVDSEDRETVQQPCDTVSEDSMQRNESVTSEASRQGKLSLSGEVSLSKRSESPVPSINSNQNNTSNNTETMLLEEQAALVDRLTKMQHDKWMLEEKLSYLEQANSALSEDLANKSLVIKSYFLNQALKATTTTTTHHVDSSGFNGHGQVFASRRTSFPGHINQILSEKPGLKRVVDFLKERSQSDNISKEATNKMQLMLEETLIKCIKLQENLDYVTGELNKLKS